MNSKFHLPWNTSLAIIIPIVFSRWKNGNGPIIENAIKMEHAPINVTILGGFLSHIRPHNGAEKP